MLSYYSIENGISESLLLADQVHQTQRTLALMRNQRLF